MDQEFKREIESVLGGSLENTNIEDLENIEKTSIDWYTCVEEDDSEKSCPIQSEQQTEQKNACESHNSSTASNNIRSRYTTSKKRYNPQNSKKFKGGAPDLSSVEAAIIDGNDVRRDIADLLN